MKGGICMFSDWHTAVATVRSHLLVDLYAAAVTIAIIHCACP